MLIHIYTGSSFHWCFARFPSMLIHIRIGLGFNVATRISHIFWFIYVLVQVFVAVMPISLWFICILGQGFIDRPSWPFVFIHMCICSDFHHKYGLILICIKPHQCLFTLSWLLRFYYRTYIDLCTISSPYYFHLDYIDLHGSISVFVSFAMAYTNPHWFLLIYS